MYMVGVDLGGTKIEAILLDDEFNALKRKRIPTPQNDYLKIIDAICHLISDVSSQADSYSLGICVPGAISKSTGMIKNSNTQCLIGKSLKEDLEEKLGTEISMENDANCFALAESTLGAGTGYDLVFGVIMGTGVGGGIVIDGKLFSGRMNIGGEWGHHTLQRNGISCYCGNSGCVECYISGPALEKRWAQLTGNDETMKSILSNNDDMFLKWKREFLENFGYALANVIDILDPDAVVLGGGLSNIDFLYSEGKCSVYQKVFSDFVDTPILKNKLGDSAGVFGACMI